MAAIRSLPPPTSAPLPRWHLPPALTIAAAALVLAARIAPVPALESTLCGLDPIRANAAACFLLAGVSLVLSGRAAAHGSRSAAGRLLGAAVALVGTLTLAEDLAGADSGLAGLLYFRPLRCDADVAMPPVTALAFVPLGAALALQPAGRARLVANALVGSVSLLTAVAGLGLLYGASTAYATGRFNAMTPLAAALFALLCAGYFVSYPGLHRAAPLYAASREASALRRLLVATLPLPPLAGAALVYGVRAGLYDVAFGAAALVASGLAVFTLLFLRNASVLDTFRRAREEAETRFRDLVEFLPDGVLVVGRDRLIRTANRRAEALFGRSRAQLVGQPLESLIPERFRAAHARHVAGYLEEPAPRVMSDGLGLTALRADGTEFPVDVSLGPLHRGDDLTAVAIVRDATERRTSDRALRESEQRYRDVVQNIDEVVYVVDVSDDPSAGRVVFVSDRVQGATGYAPSQFLDNPRLWMSAIHPEDQAAVASETGRMLRDRVPVVRLYRMRHKQTGEWRWIEDRVVPQAASNGARVRLFGVARDVTAARRIEESLRQSEARYREIFENDLTGAYIAAPDGSILACNPAFVSMFGFASVDEALRADFGAMFAGAADRAAFLDTIDAGRRIENREAELRRADGKALHVIQNAVGLFDERGRLVEVRGYLIDTTQRKHLEDQLRQAQKMEAVGRLAGGLAHDMNNMLTAILGFSEIWLAGAAPDAPGRADVEEIQDAGRRASDLTRQLLAFSRRQIVRPVVVDVNATVTGLETLVRRLIGEDVTLVTRLADGGLHVKIDPGQIEQMLVNLAVNARDAMPGGGTLAVETAACDHDAPAGHDGARARPGPHARISVSDTGTGIDEDTLPHIFEPFFTTKEAGKGTGLGLPTIYGIVRQAGGVIDVRSEPGATTFDIYLPLTDAPLTPEEPRPGGAGRQVRHLTILVVEDDDAVRRFVRRTLEAEGYRLLEAANGADALGLLDRHQDSVDLVLTDVVMPGMSGRALADQIGRRLPGVKVLYMSGYPSTVIAGQGVLDPGIHFLEKPFSGGVLKAKVVEMFAGDAANPTVH